MIDYYVASKVAECKKCGETIKLLRKGILGGEDWYHANTGVKQCRFEAEPKEGTIEEVKK